MIRLIDTPEFQRLRRIKQLGLGLYTYQGAEHSRFTHSLGALHLMTRILDQLSDRYQISEQDHAAARAAALLHDVGHGQFSHAIASHYRRGHPFSLRYCKVRPAHPALE